MKRLHVAAGVIRGGAGHVLIAKRPVDKHQGGLWEFPGGKVEPGETAEGALARELAEELGIAVNAARPLIQVRHDYPDKQVLLDVWEVLEFDGEPHGAEGQPLAWVTAEDLPRYEFPAANRPIISAARLPKSYLITPDNLAPQELLCGVACALDAGVRLLQLRCPALADAQYRTLATEVLELCAGRAQVMLKGPLEWAQDFPDAGWHLTASQLREHTDAGRPIETGRWLAASCHDMAELDLANQMGVDFIVLSPILATASHPEARPMGWQRAADMLLGFAQPAYLLGGLGPRDAERAAQIGAQGVAGIRAFWP
ncbi:Nudix family hydrolase [Stutzerimonas xanthomarina]|uniref:8-oxo-dGTP diphosphatase n=2 Tax=Stutzerimonas xanthomarina TaxID=271420 RepID=A0A1M5U121_9GAMM|nr:Nudix family hydrolase [Stutzerimonas xanthomarina]MCP9340649.1 Nudix family hydrolase [Stutzerimonas xanthomarina]SEI02483.1 8-oxo-dGTP diphosphatase [Stutzerimonas xanthomarina]SHH56561.1 8-oxo-dGTPase [Stutzerimonas xanthomarina DSM 18231]